MNLDPNSPAFPSTQTVTFEGHMCRLGDDDARIESVGGLTIRAHFALELMKGMLANPVIIEAMAKKVESADAPAIVANGAIEHADALIAALNKDSQ